MIDNIHRLSLTTERYAKGAYLYNKGESAKHLYLVVSGKVKLQIAGTTPGRAIILRIVRTNELLGILDFFDAEETRRCDAVIMDDDTVLRPILFLTFIQIVNNDWQLQLSLGKLFAELVGELQFVYENLRLRDTYTKVQRTITRLARKYGKATPKGIEITAFTHQELSEIMGISRQSVTTALSQLQRDGLVVSKRQYILVLDH